MEPVLSELIPPKARALIYLATVMLAAAYPLIIAKVDLDWWWQAAYAAWNALAGAVAVANLNRTKEPPA